MGRIALIGENSCEYISILLDIWNNHACAVLLDWRIPSGTLIDMMKEANVETCYIQDKYCNEKIHCYSRNRVYMLLLY